MPADLRYTIGIDGSAASQTLSGLKSGVNSLGSALVGMGAIGLFAKVIKDGFEFNQTMHDGELAIMAIVQQFQNLDDAAAKKVAAGAMQKIIDLAPRVAGSLSDLVQGFSSTAAASAGVGLSVDQNIDLVGRFANALGKLSMPIDQVGQELRSILSGSIGADSQLARTLGITNEMVSAAKDAGQLYEMLVAKVGKLGTAGDNAATRFSSLSSALDKAKGAMAEGLFDQALDGSVALTKALDDNIETFRELGAGLATLTTNTVKAIDKVNDWAKAIGITAGVYVDMFTNGITYAEAMANAENALTAAVNERAAAEQEAAANAPKPEDAPAAFAAPDAKKKGDLSDDRRKRQAQDAAAARNNLLGELAILEAQANRHDKKAKALERQLKIQNDMMEIMRSTGASEAEALRLATRKADLEDKLAKRKARANDDGTGPGRHIGGVTTRHGLSGGGPIANGGLNEYNRLQQKRESSLSEPALPGYRRGAYVPTNFDSLSERGRMMGRGLGQGSSQAISARVAQVASPVQGAAKASGPEADPAVPILGQVLAELKRIRTT